MLYFYEVNNNTGKYKQHAFCIFSLVKKWVVECERRVVRDNLRYFLGCLGSELTNSPDV